MSDEKYLSKRDQKICEFGINILLYNDNQLKPCNQQSSQQIYSVKILQIMDNNFLKVEPNNNITIGQIYVNSTNEKIKVTEIAVSNNNFMIIKLSDDINRDPGNIIHFKNCDFINNIPQKLNFKKLNQSFDEWFTVLKTDNIKIEWNEITLEVILLGIICWKISNTNLQISDKFSKEQILSWIRDDEEHIKEIDDITRKIINNNVNVEELIGNYSDSDDKYKVTITSDNWVGESTYIVNRNQINKVVNCEHNNSSCDCSVQYDRRDIIRVGDRVAIKLDNWEKSSKGRVSEVRMSVFENLKINTMDQIINYFNNKFFENNMKKENENEENLNNSYSQVNQSISLSDISNGNCNIM
jgi:hypothetical protein